MSAHLLFDHDDEAGDVSYHGGTSVSASTYGVTVDSTGAVNIDGLVQNVLSYMDGKMPSWVQQAVGLAAEWAGDEIAIDGAVTAFAAAAGAGTIATGPFAPMAATVMAIPVVLVALDPAQAGYGCCGASPVSAQQAQAVLTNPVSGQQPSADQVQNYVRFGTCSPAEWDWYGGSGPGAAQCDGQWAGDHWAGGCPRQWDGQGHPDWEAFLSRWIISAFNASTDCWSFMPGSHFALALSQGLGVWNRGHQGPSVTVNRLVNLPGVTTFGGYRGSQVVTTVTTGNPATFNPIDVALNFAATKWDTDLNGDIISKGSLAPISGLASFTVNTGPAWSSTLPTGVVGGNYLQLAQEELGGPPPAPVTGPAPSSGGTAVAVAAGAAAALLALKFAAPGTFAKIVGRGRRFLPRRRRP